MEQMIRLFGYNGAIFAVKKDWLLSYIRENDYGSLDDFLLAYTWDDAEYINSIAK